MIKIKNLYYLTLSLMLIFSACKDDDEELPGQPPTVDAGQDVTATVGSSVQLSGTASDPDGDPLTTSWSITSAPQGSSATISNASNLNATFTPDVEGNYTIRLTADDGVYEPVTDELIITAEEAVGEPPVVVIRNADNDAIDETNNEVTINTTYILNGSQSSDPDSEELTFSWEITEGPEDHEATLTPNEDDDMASFTPNVLGTYTIQLTVTDPEGNADTETVVLIATANPVIIDENISAATTWPNIFDDPNLPDYFVTEDISVNEVLTIMPGVKIMVEPNNGLNVNPEGAITAIGKSDSLIVFTAEDSVNGWDGIVFFSGNALNNFEYAEVSYGGTTGFGSSILAANIGIDNSSGRLKISNSTISNSFNYGIYVQDGGQIENFADNTFSENENNPISLGINQVGNLDANSIYESNSDNRVEIQGSSISSNEEQTIPTLAGGVSYFVDGPISINSGLSVSAGSSFEFDSDAYLQVNSDGYFISEGTQNDSITYTASEIINGWGGIVFFSNDNRNAFHYSSISYGGTRTWGSSIEASTIGVDNTGNIKITNSTISQSLATYGLYVQDGGQITAFAENSFINNSSLPLGIPISVAGILDAATTFSGNSNNSVELYQSTLNSNNVETIPAFSDGTSYFISGDLSISSDLIIKAGAFFEAGLDVKVQVNSTGSISAIGNTDSLITFTARNESDGWDGIVFFSNKSTNRFDYVEVAFGGKNDFGSSVLAANIGIDNTGKLAITNTIIRNSFAYGIYVQSGGELVDASNNPFATQTELEAVGNTFTENSSGPSNL